MIQNRLDPSLFTTQPVHAALAGQIADRWLDYSMFDLKQVKDEIVLGVTLHDAGWMEWDINPAINPDTSLPWDVMDVPTGEHVEIWQQTVSRAQSLPPLAEWLILVHHCYLSGIRNTDRAGDQEAETNQQFYNRVDERRISLEDQFRAHDFYQHFTGREQLERLRRLMLVWDFLSLLLCMDFEEDQQINQVPFNEEWTELTLSKKGSLYQLKPWPFGPDMLHFRLNGYRLKPASKENEIASQLRNAQTESRLLKLAKSYN